MIDFEALAVIPEQWARPPAEMVTQLNRGKGVMLDYVGHADITLILCKVDPAWTYDWNRNADGDMAIRKSGQNLVLEGALTVHAVTRPCVGTCQASRFEPEKELTGDLIRNGAMRFGIATKLWSKLDDANDDHQAQEPEPHPNADRVAAVIADMRALDDASKADLRDYAGDRKLSGAYLLEHDGWLNQVEFWLAERADPT